MMSDRHGFTLIEMLIVVVVIGILTAIALPKFGQTREAAFYSTMRADLNNLRMAQEVYFQSGNFRYTSNLTALDVNLSSGVTIPTLNTLNNGRAWEAVANHSGVGVNGACVIGFGSLGSASWSASGGTPAVSVTDQNAGAPVCND